MPSDFSASMCSAPAASWTIPLPAAIVLTGRVAAELVSTTPSWPLSSPSSPALLLPQVHTEVTAEMPSIRVATEANQPAEMPVTWVRPATLTGTGLSAVLPLPS